MRHKLHKIGVVERLPVICEFDVPPGGAKSEAFELVEFLVPVDVGLKAALGSRALMCTPRDGAVYLGKHKTAFRLVPHLDYDGKPKVYGDMYGDLYLEETETEEDQKKRIEQLCTT